MPLSLRKAQSRRANAKAAAVCRRRLFHSTGIGRLSTELILALLGDHSTREVLKVRGSTRELCRIASMDSLWAPTWEAIDAEIQADALTLVPASVSQVPTHSPLFCADACAAAYHHVVRGAGLVVAVATGNG